MNSALQCSTLLIDPGNRTAWCMKVFKRHPAAISTHIQNISPRDVLFASFDISYREVKILSRYLHIPQGSTPACSHTNIVQSTDWLSSLASEDSENKFALKH